MSSAPPASTTSTVTVSGPPLPATPATAITPEMAVAIEAAVAAALAKAGPATSGAAGGGDSNVPCTCGRDRDQIGINGSRWFVGGDQRIKTVPGLIKIKNLTLL